MIRQMLKSKIHKAVVTGANVLYEGSITIDEAVMKKARILEFERVQIANLRTGGRWETYVIRGRANSGIIGMNGAAARLVSVGDELHILSYVWLNDQEMAAHRPLIVHLDGKNRLRKRP